MREASGSGTVTDTDSRAFFASDIDADAPMEVYGLSGVKAGESLDGLAPGVYVVRQGGKVRKIAVK